MVNILKYLPSFFRKILKKKFDDCKRKLVYFKMYLSAEDMGFHMNLNKKTLAEVLIRYFSINKWRIQYDVFYHETG